MDSSSSRHEIEGVNREKARQRVESLLSTLLQDPILSDVPKHSLSVSDADVLINLELGSAIRLTILKMDNTSFEVAVLNSATVKDLKVAVRKKVNEMEQANMGHRHISWKHVWANYCLVCNGAKLINEKSLLSAYGIRNNCKIEFLPDVTSRLREKHSRRRKHRFFHGLSKKCKT
ncbi:ubiquitin-like superfamily protein [Carex rostrata]